MYKHIKKILSLVLSAFIFLSCFSGITFTSFASDIDEASQIDNDLKSIRHAIDELKSPKRESDRFIVEYNDGHTETIILNEKVNIAKYTAKEVKRDKRIKTMQADYPLYLMGFRKNH